jgi:hypothetical protein
VNYYCRRFSFVIPDEAELQWTIHGEEIRYRLVAIGSRLKLFLREKGAGTWACKAG